MGDNKEADKEKREKLLKLKLKLKAKKEKEKNRPKRVAALGAPADDVELLKTMIAKLKRKREIVSPENEVDNEDKNIDIDIKNKVKEEDEAALIRKRKNRNKKALAKIIARRLSPRKCNKDKIKLREAANAAEHTDPKEEMARIQEKLMKRKLIQTNELGRDFYNYRMDDIVSTKAKGQTYYAQVKGFFTNDFSKKFLRVRWLIPKRDYSPMYSTISLKNFNRLHFQEGPDELFTIDIDLFNFVMRPNEAQNPQKASSLISNAIEKYEEKLE